MPQGLLSQRRILQACRRRCPLPLRRMRSTRTQRLEHPLNISGDLDQEMALTKRYPPAHPDTIIPIATLTLALPKTLLATVGMVAKKPPFAAPLIITKAASRPSEVET